MFKYDIWNYQNSDQVGRVWIASHFLNGLSNQLSFPSTKDNATYNLGLEYNVHAH